MNPPALVPVLRKMDPDVSKILDRFGVKPGRIIRPPDAKLARVYFVDNDFVLRSRPLEADTPSRFDAERKLCRKVSGLTGSRFPQYRATKSGEPWVADGNQFWTLHQRIAGKPLGSWFELHRVDPSVTRRVLHVLRRMHGATFGCFGEKIVDRTRLLQLTEPVLSRGAEFLDARTLDCLNAAFARVRRFCQTYSPEEACFVHGDYHHGNILAQNGEITGFIDLDWCRAASFYEDLAFTLMMLLRDYKGRSPAFRKPVYDQVLTQYGFQGDISLLNDHLLLYALFDYAVFKSASFENAGFFFQFQARFLEKACIALAAVEA